MPETTKEIYEKHYVMNPDKLWYSEEEYKQLEKEYNFLLDEIGEKNIKDDKNE